MARRRGPIKRDRNGRFARKAGSALATRAPGTLRSLRTRPPTKTPSGGYAKAAVLFGTVGVAAVAANNYRKSPERKKRKAARAKRRADFRRREDAFARGAQGARAYG